ncbi:aspartate/glutamate racemase family protein [Litoribacillus peritrichatus]|uniref:Aspartate/glutamate racemase family protein n=1 Tax=Litoribacillus peritrichatus TaxID=718191 RepID=A0ABP7MP47_9GAMM
MTKPFRMKVIIPINNASYNDELKEVVTAVAPPDLYIEVDNIKAGNTSIESRWDKTVNAPHVVAMVVQAEHDGFDGVFVSDFDFCGVEEARELVDIPVVGGFRPSAYTAMMLAEKFSIVTFAHSVMDMQSSHSRLFGIAPNFASISPIDLTVHQLVDRDKVVEKVYQASLTAIEAHGADAIILGCTGFNYIAEPVARLLKEKYQVNVPVIDPNHAAVSYLYGLIRNNLSQSRLTYVTSPNYSGTEYSL